jgi:hypothetical protein
MAGLIQPHSFGNDANAVDVVLTQEANRIGSDIHKATLHTSPWIDLIKQTTFPEGMGYQLSTLIYDSALPLTPAGQELGGGSVTGTGIGFSPVGTTGADGNSVGYTSGQQDATSVIAPNKIDFTKTLKSYSLEKGVIESPRINVEELRFAAHRTEQLRAIMDLLKEATRNAWENRYRDEYGKVCDNIVYAKDGASATTYSKFTSGHEGTKLLDVAVDRDSDQGDGADNNTLDCNANISNALMDAIRFRLIRAGARDSAYGMENGSPIFSVVLSSEASHQLKTEDNEIRQDIRFNNAAVGDLIRPLGVEQSFRGFYHLIDDLAPRFSDVDDADGKLRPVYPFTHNATTKKIEVNELYNTAQFEAAYVLVDNVMESLIPAPITNANGLTFDPVSYKGDFKWTNIPDATINPDGQIGFFRGILASASKPIKTNFGYIILFDRTETDSAKVG